jgi:superfamily II DNA/RNA helicase
MLCDSTWILDQETHFSTKLEEFRQLLPELVEGGRKALVFSCWERMTQLAARELDQLGIRYVRFHGRLSLRERRGLVDEFMGDPGCLVFLSTDAGGLGLNLQAASTVVNLDLPWNPAVLDQRVGRAHRMGQKRTVNVINLIARGAIEERIWDLMKLKRALFQERPRGGPGRHRVQPGGPPDLPAGRPRDRRRAGLPRPAPTGREGAAPGRPRGGALGARQGAPGGDGRRPRAAATGASTGADGIGPADARAIRTLADALIGALGG